MSRKRKEVTAENDVTTLETYCATLGIYRKLILHKIDEMEDHRAPDKCIYTKAALIIAEIFRCFTHTKSHRALDHVSKRHKENCVNNLNVFCATKMKRFPTGQAINYFLRKLDPYYIRGILIEIIRAMHRGKKLKPFTERLEHTLLLASDGTGLCSSIKDLPFSTVRHHLDGSVKHHIYVVNQSLVSPYGLILPVSAEFVANDDDYNPEFDKQDCEYKAQLKQFDWIAEQFPQQRFTILMDALSLNYPMMKKVLEKKWHFVISYRKGCVKGLDEVVSTKINTPGLHIEKSTSCRLSDGSTVHRIYKMCTLEYTFGKADTSDPIVVTYASMREDISHTNGKKEVKTYERITSHALKTDGSDIVTFFEDMGSTRWVQENQGHNEMKNLGLNVGHLCGISGKAAVNHYNIELIAFVIMQIAGKTDIYKCISEHHNPSLKGKIASTLRKEFKTLEAIGRECLIALTTLIVRVFKIKDLRIHWDTC